MAKYFVEDTSLTAVADAIRTKGGTSEALSFPDGFVSAVEGIQTGGGGDDSVLSSILDRSITEFSNNDIFSVGDYALYNCNKLSNLTLPNLTSTSHSSFYGCASLEEIILPAFKYAGHSTFRNCTRLASVDFPVLESATNSVFEGCTSIENLHLPKLAGIADYMCNGCTKLQSINCPNATVVRSNAFSNCKMLKQISLPLATRIMSYAFNNNTSVEEVVFPSCSSVDTRAFYGCTELQSVQLGGTSSLPSFIGTNNFSNCTKFSVLVLHSPVMWTLANVNSFDGTPFASGGTGGTVYVPSALITQYQQATNWSTLYAAGTCNFVAIEGSEYE